MRGLLTTSQSKYKMQSTLLLDIIIRECTAILQLFPSKNQSLLVRWNSLLILNLTLDVINGIRRFHFKRDRFARQGFHER